MTDLEIELYDGSDHQWHTHPLDFAVATPMGIQDGLQRAGSVLLEPMLSCRFVVPADCGGRLMSDLATMRGRFSAPEQLMDVEGIGEGTFEGLRELVTVEDSK